MGQPCKKLAQFNIQQLFSRLSKNTVILSEAKNLFEILRRYRLPADRQAPPG